MTYQDKWAGGKAIEFGYRECADRYKVVYDFCISTICRTAFSMHQAFHVRDIGANLCYFGLRLTEDFPRCRVTAYENNKHAANAAERHLDRHGNCRLTLERSRLTPEAVRSFEVCDLTLAMSVLHHMPDGLEMWLDALRESSRHIIVELAQEPSARNSDRQQRMPSDARIIGYGASHLESAMRPIYYLRGK
jgi:hypothetical protein